jgi:hypothetical protein
MPLLCIAYKNRFIVIDALTEIWHHILNYDSEKTVGCSMEAACNILRAKAVEHASAHVLLFKIISNIN